MEELSLTDCDEENVLDSNNDSFCKSILKSNEWHDSITVTMYPHTGNEILTGDIATSSSSRFSTVDDIEKFKKSRFPDTTMRKVKWVMNTFTEWLIGWQTRSDGSPKVKKPLHQMNVQEIDHVLQFFFAEVRKTTGALYPPRTLKEIAAAIQHHLNYELNIPTSIFRSPEFLGARASLDAAMKRSAAAGTVKPKKRAAAISMDSEDKLWKTGCLGMGNPQQLLDTVVYTMGLHLALRACQEHRNLRYGPTSQLTLEKDADGREKIKYIENSSKNRAFGIHQANLEPKVT